MTPRIAFLVHQGANELDTFASFYIIARASRFAPVHVELVSAAPRLVTMHGVELRGYAALEAANSADAVVISSGGTLRAIEEGAVLTRLRLDPTCQLIGSQCSGALLLARLGLLRDQPACTDESYRSHVEAEGVHVLQQPFHAHGSIATAGGCLSAPYLAMWLLWRLLGREIAEATLTTVAPVGTEAAFVANIVATVERFCSHPT